MSNKNDDIEDSLQQNSQPEPPMPQSGSRSGPAPDASRPWENPHDGAAIQTDLQSVSACKKCNGPIPVGASRCPRCQCFVSPQSGRKRRKGDVHQIHSDLVAQFSPTSRTAREECLHLAVAYAELRTLTTGTLEWQRTVAIAQQLRTSLEASRPARTTSVEDLSQLSPDQRATRAEALAVRLRAAADAQQSNQPGQSPSDEKKTSPEATSPADPPPGGLSACDTPPPAEPARCAFCSRSLSECSAFRRARPEDWRAIHYDHEDVRRERDERATREMLDRIGQPNRQW